MHTQSFALQELVIDFRRTVEVSDTKEAIRTPGVPVDQKSPLKNILLEKGIGTLDENSREELVFELQKYFEHEGYFMFNYRMYGKSDHRRLQNILIQLLECGEHYVKIASFELLIDIYDVEHIVFANAERSYLCTAASKAIQEAFQKVTKIRCTPELYQQQVSTECENIVIVIVALSILFLLVCSCRCTANNG